MKPRRWLTVAATILMSPLTAFAQSPPSEISAILTPPRENGRETERREEEPERERDEIETDRDSFTPSTKTVGHRRLVLETGYSFLDNRARAETHSFPEFLARYGMTERIELRLGWNYEVGGAPNSVSGQAGGEETFVGGIERDSKITYGVKLGLMEQCEWRPECALILAGSTPTGGPEHASQFVGTYGFGWKLPNSWKLDSSIRFGANTSEGDRFSTWSPSVVVKAPVGEKVGVHVEYFSAFTHAKAQDAVLHYVSPGVHYLVTEDFEIGVRLGWGLNDQSARFFSNVGLGWRF